LQNKDQTIKTLTEENANFTTVLNTAEARLYEFYTEQARMEEEMSARIEVTEKLRAQVRELEKERRDLHRRYNEQTATFEAERQSFYDNEQHLRSRIQSLTQRKQPTVPPSPTVLVMPETDTEEEEEEEAVEPSVSSQEKEDPHAEPAEMTALKLELSTLSTSHASIQNTLVLLQTQLVDLKRVNNQLQEENESYNILLREKTISGQYDLFRRVSEDSPSFGDEDGQTDDMGDVQSVQSAAHSIPLGTVDEHPDEGDLHTDLGTDHGGDLMQSSDDEGSLARDGSNRGKRSRHGRNRHGGSSRSPPPRGESLAGLPITGPGLDLAAELGRAENKDILEDDTVDVSGPPRDKRGKKGKVSAADPGMERTDSVNEVDSLRIEIKSLKDANKALSLYASKIIDRIIAQEGFEHVLAADYEAKSPATPTATMASPDTSAGADQKPKRRNTMSARLNSNPSPNVEKLTTFNSPPLSNSRPSRSSRRSLSFDWRALSSFVSGDKDKKSDANPSLRPLTLKPGTISGARKLETQEDEEDRRERERLNATMKLMGIEKPPPVPPPTQEVNTTSETLTPTVENVGSPSLTSRFSFFRRSPAPAESTPNSSAEALQGNPIHLTHDTLVQAQAEESLAALDAHERILSTEMAKGGSGGFTEILPRRKSGSRRSHTSGGGSGSTVWSAGMSRTGEDD
jgi:hypothetical protein